MTNPTPVLSKPARERKEVLLNDKLVATIAYELDKNNWERNIITTISVMGGVWGVLRQRKAEVIKILEDSNL